MSETITIPTTGGEFAAYVARPAQTPATTPAPAVVVLHEVFGVNEDIRTTCRELAAQGFIALAPELFWRQERGVDLNTWSAEEWKKGLALYTAYDRDAGVGDVVATIRAAEHLAGSNGKVGVMGFCLGGLMTYLTAVRHRVTAAVAYHGGETETYLGEAGSLIDPLLMHLAEEDEYISKEAQAQIKAALAGKPNVTIHSYPGQNHAFARHTGTHYNAAAAALATERTRSFLGRHLGLIAAG